MEGGGQSRKLAGGDAKLKDIVCIERRLSACIGVDIYIEASVL